MYMLLSPFSTLFIYHIHYYPTSPQSLCNLAQQKSKTAKSMYKFRNNDSFNSDIHSHIYIYYWSSLLLVSHSSKSIFQMVF